MSIEITMPKDTFKALAEFVSPRTGGQDTNPNAAVHFRYRDDNSLRAAVTNGRIIMLAALFKGSDQLTNCYFPDTEQQTTVSIIPTRGLLTALAGEGKVITLAISDVFCKVRTSGDTGITEHVVPRLCGRQMALFDDLDSLPQYGVDHLAERAQNTLDPAIIGKIARAAKLLKLSGHLTVTSIRDLDGGAVYGFQIGSDNTVWWTMRQEVPVTAALAGLPPDWVGARGGQDAFSVLLDRAAEIESEYEVVSQADLPFDSGEEEGEDDELAIPDESPDFSAQVGAGDENSGDAGEVDDADFTAQHGAMFETERAQDGPDDSPAFVLRFHRGDPPLSFTLQQIATHPQLAGVLDGLETSNLEALKGVAQEHGYDGIVEAVDEEMAARDAA